MLAASGIQITGIDRSGAMLAIARQKAERKGLAIAWIEADMREFAVTEPVDLITRFYDAINYLVEPDDVAAVFERALQALNPGGLFIFDVNTRVKFAENWNESCYLATNRDDLFGLYQSWFDAETGLSPLILTFFVRNEGGLWERFDEEHIERAYPLDEISDALKKSGFLIQGARNYVDRSPRLGGPASEHSQRVVFVAQRGDR